ncbi:class I SAM-dependent methyltransferase [Jeotgalibacillus sp. R-1-5s-1]|uniref:class I SAM-dependent DNA methyltransferase n=1 Tax=Jeotgalibacillus sp. R-1-5s-1 TaxID=2555897 RepID=UPI00106ACFDB|nr:class I SAM-dependent methyltransferase [Jeotgalibacillus sp. R-1-5s-1]TFD92353.1 class I SAM-dependent methyltransferase [Jeotgalibacillus sp. R-1-5s-1]
MSYESFALVYDQLMADVPYDSWMAFLVEATGDQGYSAKRLLDVGCGTGEWTLKASEYGYDVTGIDLSSSMLAIAREKAEEAGLKVDFLEMNMTDVQGFEPFDRITIFCDSLNYLETEEEVQKTFANMAALLKSGGYFLFDVHSVYKMNHLFIGQSYHDDTGEAAYIWDSFEGEFENSVEHELSFFIEEESGLYRRYDELHKQRTFTAKQYQKWLEEAGFQVKTISADFTMDAPEETSERIFFVCIKP